MIPPHIRICLAAFLLAFGTTLGYHATPFYAFDHLGGDALMSGTFGAVQSVVYVATSLLSVRLIARTKRGLDLGMMGTTAFAISFGVMPLIHVPWLCIASSAIGLGGMALTWPSFHSWIGGETDPAKRARHMSWLNIGWSSASALSPLFAGPLYDMDYHYPFYGAFFITLIVVAILRTMPHEDTHFGAATQEFLAARAGHDRAATIYLWPAWISVLVVHALNSSLRMVFPKRIDELVTAGQLRWFSEAEAPHFLTHNPATIFSVLAFSISFGTATAFFTMGRTNGWKHRFATMFWPQCAAMAALFVLGTTHSLAAMAAAFFVIGAGLGMCFFGSSYYSLADPAMKHRRSALNEGMVGGGALLGSFAFGELAASFGTAMPFLWAPLGIAVLVAAQYGVLRAARRA